MNLKLLDIQFNNHHIKHNEKIKLHLVQTKPKINFDFNPTKLYTILMVDPDAQSKLDPNLKNWLHWMIINTNNNIIPFQPSAPGQNSGLHRYYFYLFKQNKYINPSEIIAIYFKDHKINRSNFNKENFIKKYKLELIAENHYLTEFEN